MLTRGIDSIHLRDLFAVILGKPKFVLMLFQNIQDKEKNPQKIGKHLFWPLVIKTFPALSLQAGHKVHCEPRLMPLVL